jgi:23S rRNA pseudouridine1911/1915/1917 synthase
MTQLASAQLLAVSPPQAGQRLDAFLVRNGTPESRSRAEWQRLIDLASVTVNDRPARAGQRLTAGDRVQVAAEAPSRSTPEPAPDPDVPFRVLFEDPSMIVLDKPAGVVVHPAPGNERGTLVNGLLARYPELADDTTDQRPGIVHRLDQDTSGVMVVGRTPAATANLQRQMQRRTTEKRYLLLVRGTIAEDQGLIDGPIGRDPRHRQRMAVRAGGRSAQTRFQVLERFGDYTLIDALLLTGRTHQLRVHFASIGHPLAGDRTYGPGRGPGGLARQFLHAHLLRLRSPFDDVEHTFVAGLPPDLSEVLDTLRRRHAAARH